MRHLIYWRYTIVWKCFISRDFICLRYFIQKAHTCVYLCAHTIDNRENVTFLWIIMFQFLFNFIQDGHFRECSRTGQEHKSPLPKICHTNPTMMKLGTVIPYLKKIQEIYESCSTPHWILLTSAFFHWKPENFVMSRNTDKDCILIHNF